MQPRLGVSNIAQIPYSERLSYLMVGDALPRKQTFIGNFCTSAFGELSTLRMRQI
jgi:hypothetical protein